jgi:hypothetical protein
MNTLIGAATLLICMFVQCVVVMLVVHWLRSLQERGLAHLDFARSCGILFVALLMLVVGNIIQVMIWAFLFLALGEIADVRTAIYFSLVNFATLGYGDIVLGEGRRILGAMEALAGVLMLGLSTSLLFAVLSTLISKRHDAHS